MLEAEAQEQGPAALRRELGLRPGRSRRSARSWRRPAGRSSGSTARRPTAARTRSTTPTAARCGGGVLIGKGCHPLTAALYLKRVEGRARDGKPIRPRTGLRPDARHHAAARLPRRGAHPLRLLRHRRLLDDARRVRRRHDRRRVRLGHRAGRHPQLAGDLRQQPPHDLQHQSQHGDADLQPGGGELRATSTSSRRSAPSRAGPAPRPTRTGSPATRRRSRPFTARSPTASRPKATAAWPPTRSRRSTAPTSRPSARARQCRSSNRPSLSSTAQ